MLLEALSKSEDCFMTSEGSQCTKKVIAQVSIAESAEKTKFVVLWKQVVMQVLGSLLVLVAETEIIYPFWTNFQMLPILYLTRYGKRRFLGHAPGLATINVIVYVNSLHGLCRVYLLQHKVLWICKGCSHRLTIAYKKHKIQELCYVDCWVLPSTTGYYRSN
jgi:hypothetical protein